MEAAANIRDCKSPYSTPANYKFAGTGVASLSYSPKEKTLSIGYPFKRGNSWMENIGYGLGAFYNITDLYRLVTWDALSGAKAAAALKNNTGHADDERIVYNENVQEDAIAGYQPSSGKIELGARSMRGRGWSKSTLEHEWDHLERFNMDDYIANNGGAYEDQLDYYAYTLEANNAVNNGLSYNQYREVVGKVYEYARKCGAKNTPSLLNYSFKMYWSWIRSFYTF